MYSRSAPRRRHGAEFKAKVLAACDEPGASISGVALAHGLNANLVRQWRAGRGVKLTTREFELLAYLMRHPDQVLSRAQILNAVWGYDHDPGTNVLEVYIGYLRRKLAAADGDAPIQTMRSAGYRLVSADA